MQQPVFSEKQRRVFFSGQQTKAFLGLLTEIDRVYVSDPFFNRREPWPETVLVRVQVDTAVFYPRTNYGPPGAAGMSAFHRNQIVREKGNTFQIVLDKLAERGLPTERFEDIWKIMKRYVAEFDACLEMPSIGVYIQDAERQTGLDLSDGNRDRLYKDIVGCDLPDDFFADPEFFSKANRPINAICGLVGLSFAAADVVNLMVIANGGDVEGLDDIFHRFQRCELTVQEAARVLFDELFIDCEGDDFYCVRLLLNLYKAMGIAHKVKVMMQVPFDKRELHERMRDQLRTFTTNIDSNEYKFASGRLNVEISLYHDHDSTNGSKIESALEFWPLKTWFGQD